MEVKNKKTNAVIVASALAMFALTFVLSFHGLNCETIWDNQESTVFTNIVTLFSGFWFTYGIIPTAICGYFGFFKESKAQDGMRKGFYGCLVVWAVCFIGGAFVYNSITTFVKTLIGQS